jgi:DinB family protein
MTRLTANLQRLYVRELEAFRREIELFPDDALPWRTAPGIANSAATLGFHVCGNLQHYVGHVLGGTSYVRDRGREFARRDGTRADLAREIAATIAVLEAVMPKIDEATLARDYPEEVIGMRIPTDLFLLHLSAHLAHHLGQAGYLRRLVTGDTRSSGPLPMKALLAKEG